MDRMADITSDCVHELFERQARINPTALAVAEGNRYLSYGELDSRSNELAHHLLSAGVGPEVVVGLCSPSSIAMVVGALAILKAGGAYLPLDPSHPAQRLSSILREAGVPVLMVPFAWRNRSRVIGGAAITNSASRSPTSVRGGSRRKDAGDAEEFGVCDIYLRVNWRAQGS